MSTRTRVPARSTAFLIIGIVGLAVLVGAAVLIALGPETIGPYFTALGGLGLVGVGFGSRRALSKSK